MARKAPAVERTVALLNLLAASPHRRFTLSEIAREIDLNKATLHAILGELTAAGYLVRDDARKTYGLGPVLVAVGHAAISSLPAAQLAQPEMDTLHAELGLECVASSAISDEIVILERAGTPRPFGINVAPGQRLPLAPPLGAVFVAWSGPAAVERWLSKVPRQMRDDHRRAVDAVRDRGWSFGLETAPVPRGLSMREAVRELGLQEYAAELVPDGTYRLNHIGAPVFGPAGDVTLALFLIGFAGSLRGADVNRFASRLVSAATRITGAIGGRAPAA